MGSDTTTLDPITVAAPGFVPNADADEVTIHVAGQAIAGWQQVRIIRSLDQCPNTFDLAYSEQDGLGFLQVIEPGDPCQIFLGRDRIVSGYADQVIGAFTAQTHDLRLQGRGKCQDLVDCTAEWPTATIANADVKDVAVKLAEPYGISVDVADGTSLAAPLPAFNVSLFETPFALIEEMARYYQVLAYEGANGNLVLAAVGKARHASGFQEGVNVQAATVARSMAQRFSEYHGHLFATQMYSDLGDDVGLLAKETDPGVTRHRRRAFQVEAASPSQSVGAMRVAWERTRRAGMAEQVTVTVDSWRDSAGALWTPNQLARVQLPSLHLADETWIISEVAFLRDDREGTRAEVTLMAPTAFSPEPILLQPQVPDVTPVGGG